MSGRTFDYIRRCRAGYLVVVRMAVKGRFVSTCVVVWALSLGSSLAQSADRFTDRLTDQQLRAGYCVGVMQSRLASNGPVPAPRSLDAIVAELRAKGTFFSDDKTLMMFAVSTAKLEESKRSFAQDTEDMHRRLSSYLVATGALTDFGNSQSLLGIDVAKKQGVADNEQCSATDHCTSETDAVFPHVPGMSEKDIEEHSKEYAQQLVKCRNDIPVCIKPRLCGQFVNELP